MYNGRDKTWNNTTMENCFFCTLLEDNSYVRVLFSVAQNINIFQYAPEQKWCGLSKMVRFVYRLKKRLCYHTKNKGNGTRGRGISKVVRVVIFGLSSFSNHNFRVTTGVATFG